MVRRRHHELGNGFLCPTRDLRRSPALVRGLQRQPSELLQRYLQHTVLVLVAPFRRENSACIAAPRWRDSLSCPVGVRLRRVFIRSPPLSTTRTDAATFP